MKRTLFAVTGLVLVLGFVLAATMFRERRAAELGTLAEEQDSIFVRPHSPTLGDEDARVVLVKFTDPACETCAAFSPLVKRLMAADFESDSASFVDTPPASRIPLPAQKTPDLASPGQVPRTWEILNVSTCLNARSVSSRTDSKRQRQADLQRVQRAIVTLARDLRALDALMGGIARGLRRNPQCRGNLHHDHRGSRQRPYGYLPAPALERPGP